MASLMFLAISKEYDRSFGIDILSFLRSSSIPNDVVLWAGYTITS